MVLEDATWTEDAQQMIEHLAATGRRFDVNDLRARLRPAPRSGMYGAAFNTAKARGVIAEVGTARAVRRTSHGRRVVAWAGT